MAERFDQYMERCLYHPETGFYSSGAGSAGGRSGDFITSPEVGPLFAEVVGAALDAWWHELGQPDPFLVVDAGSGPGTLGQMLARAEGPSTACRQILSVDRSQQPADEAATVRVGDVVGDAVGLPTDLTGAVVIANELLDNLPFRIFERVEQGWAELHITMEDGHPAEELHPVADVPADRHSDLLSDLASGLAVGVRIPLVERAGAWVDAVLERGPAVVLSFDYGSATTADLARRGGWLRTYRRHQRGDDPYLEPGQWDITTDVPIDQLPTPVEVLSQADFLRRWGIEALVEDGRRYWAEHASAPDLRAMRMRSRVNEAAALTDPAGLGGWLVCRWTNTSLQPSPQRSPQTTA